MTGIWLSKDWLIILGFNVVCALIVLVFIASVAHAGMTCVEVNGITQCAGTIERPVFTCVTVNGITTCN